MQEELKLYHLPRNEKKRLVKGWHAQKALPDSSSSISSDEFTEANQFGRSGSLRALFTTPPGALEYENQRTETWRSVSDHITTNPDIPHSQQETERIPKTVGQVKHAYRTRARKQEAREALNAVQKRERILEIRRGPRWRERAKVKLHEPNPVEAQQEEVNNDEDVDSLPEVEGGDELKLVNLSIEDVEVDATYRNELLRKIRQQLSQGGEVLLQSDCSSGKDSVQNTRFMLQTLCTQSLAYCVRDQDVVPDAVHLQPTTTRLVLRLLPRNQLQPLQ